MTQCIEVLDAWPWEPGMVGSTILFSPGKLSLPTQLAPQNLWTCDMRGLYLQPNKQDSTILHINSRILARSCSYFCTQTGHVLRLNFLEGSSLVRTHPFPIVSVSARLWTSYATTCVCVCVLRVWSFLFKFMWQIELTSLFQAKQSML